MIKTNIRKNTIKFFVCNMDSILPSPEGISLFSSYALQNDSDSDSEINSFSYSQSVPKETSTLPVFFHFHNDAKSRGMLCYSRPGFQLLQQ